MVKVVSFGLWGTEIRYLIGAIKNAELVNKLLPGWQSWFYVGESVPKFILDKLRSIPDVVIIPETDIRRSMMWRFKSIDHPAVEVSISRDCDSRISPREVAAVNEWLESGKTFHIMRDHPHHDVEIMGGMFGVRTGCPVVNWIRAIEAFEPERNELRNYDQRWLRNFVYPQVKHNCMIHDEIIRLEGDECRKFPVPYDDKLHFVGEYIDECDRQSPVHKLILRDYLACRNGDAP